MNEIWKPVKGYEGLYEVSNLGRVKSLGHYVSYVRGDSAISYKTKPKIMKPQSRQHGYLGVQLHGKGGHKTRNFKTFSIHRLVAEAFIENPDNLPEVNHKDEDKTNNCVDNLEWISHRDNTVYGTAQLRGTLVGKDNPRSIPVVQYTLDGELIKVFESMGRVRAAGYSPSYVDKCIKGIYKHAYGYKWGRIK